MSHTKPVPARRWLFGISIIAAWSVLMVVVAREAHWLAAVAAGALFTVPLCSLGEYLVHGVLYHADVPGFRKIRIIHHNGHHFALFPPKRYVQDGPYEFMNLRAPLMPFKMADNALDNFITMYSQVALHFVAGIPLILVPAWLSTGSVPFLASCLATLAAISWLLGYVHGTIHTPGDRWIEHQAWYQWLDRHHYIHHIDLGANMNFMMPLCDVLFGTLKTELTPEEAARHPSFEDAKPMAKDIPGNGRRPPRYAHPSSRRLEQALGAAERLPVG